MSKCTWLWVLCEGEISFPVQQISSAKITDYNLYDLTAQSDWVPVRWLAPETLKYRKCNEKADMWSYGKEWLLSIKPGVTFKIKDKMVIMW